MRHYCKIDEVIVRKGEPLIKWALSLLSHLMAASLNLSQLRPPQRHSLAIQQNAGPKEKPRFCSREN